MADFSHVRFESLGGFVRRVKSGWRPYDEYLLEAVESIRPPLLRGEHLKALRRYLDPASPQIRGRPRKDQPRKLMLVIGSERRSGPAQNLIRILLKRLASGPHCSIQNDFKAYQRYRGRIHCRRAGEVLHPERESPEILEALRQEMGSDLFSAQYQQDPVPEGGLVFKAAWLKYYNPAKLDRSGGMIVQSWDTGNKTGETNAYSVCVTALVLGKLIYVVDIFRARLETPDLLKQAIALGLAYRPHALLVEDKASGEALIQFLRAERDPILHPLPRRPEADKFARARGVSPIVEQNRLWLPEEAAWLGEFKAELLGFPNVRYYDQVDALSQLLDYVRQQDIYIPPTLAGPQLMDPDGRYDEDQDDYDGDPWGAY